jgi:hypothetical protein
MTGSVFVYIRRKKKEEIGKGKTQRKKGDSIYMRMVLPQKRTEESLEIKERRIK